MFSQVFVCPQSPSWLLDHGSALLWRGRYASYWNAFLFLISMELPCSLGVSVKPKMLILRLNYHFSNAKALLTNITSVSLQY